MFRSCMCVLIFIYSYIYTYRKNTLEWGGKETSLLQKLIVFIGVLESCIYIQSCRARCMSPQTFVCSEKKSMQSKCTYIHVCMYIYTQSGCTHMLCVCMFAGHFKYTYRHSRNVCNRNTCYKRWIGIYFNYAFPLVFASRAGSVVCVYKQVYVCTNTCMYAICVYKHVYVCNRKICKRPDWGVYSKWGRQVCIASTCLLVNFWEASL